MFRSALCTLLGIAWWNVNGWMYGAEECESWIWNIPDRTPARRYDEIAWESIKGVDSEIPAPQNNIKMMNDRNENDEGDG